MHASAIDFSLLLVILVFVTGIVSLVDWLFLKPRRNTQNTEASPIASLAETTEPLPSSLFESPVDEKSKLTEKGSPSTEVVIKEPLIVEYSKSFFPVLLIVLLLRSFLVEPFKIPSGSMLPTLQEWDYILVSKFSYGLRLPVIGTKIMALGNPEVGDVMVFKFPHNPRINYIKRVIGKPGDRIVYKDKKLFINGNKVAQKFLARIPPKSPQLNVFLEKIGDVEHQIYTSLYGGIGSGEWQVPAGHYFVMGDNRDNSNDSRVWGFVPERFVVGRAFAIWMQMPGWIPSFSRNGWIE